MKKSIIWTLAGSDPSSGAGVPADLKTIHGLDGYGCAVVTNAVAQNTAGVQMLEPVSPAMLRAQIHSLAADIQPAALKIGMLGSAEQVQLVAAELARLPGIKVGDPVIRSSSGAVFLDAPAVEAYRKELLPHLDLITPNVPEAQQLAGRTIESDDDMPRAAEALLKLGAKRVLLKGGHLGGAWAQDYFTDGRAGWWITSPRVAERAFHGTGCTLSAAIATLLAQELDWLSAVVVARTYLNQGLRLAEPVGQGRVPLFHGGFPGEARDFPWVTRTAAAGRNCAEFPACGWEKLGFYPIVDRAAWLEKLLPAGVTTIQLRIKDLAGAALEEEILRAVEISRMHQARLFINDYWELAIRHGAYGVHLGQEDVATAGLAAIRAAGLRLGLSTHTFGEMAIAWAQRPSYLAIGVVHLPFSKSWAGKPLGVDGFARMRKLAGVPAVAIGGITLDMAPELIRRGAESIAVITDVVKATDPVQRARAWLECFKERAE